MNLPAVNIQTDSGADAMTFLQVGPGSALRTCLLYEYKLTTAYQYKCTFRDEKKDTNRESSDTSEKGWSQIRRQQERNGHLPIFCICTVCVLFLGLILLVQCINFPSGRASLFERFVGNFKTGGEILLIFTFNNYKQVIYVCSP